MIELSRLIRELRAELNEAMADGAGEDLRFEVGPIELEMTLAVTREASAGGKVKFWVIEADAGGKLADITTQHLKISLNPKLATTGRAPEISGRADARER